MSNRFLIAILGCCLAHMLTSCTHITVLGANGPSSRYHLGLAVFKADRDAPLTYFRQQAVGAAVGAKNATLGYLREEIVQVNDPSACRAVLVINTAKDREWVNELFAATPDLAQSLCVLPPEENANE